MASNDDGKAMPLSRDKGKSAYVKCCNQRWNEIKSDALQIYKEEDKDLQFTMNAIQEIYGFKASTRRWKDKFKEWGCKKNIPIHDMQWIVARGTKRAGEGKDTAFFHNDTRVTTQRIENFKRRKTKGEPASISTPPNIMYSTPAGRDSPPAGQDSEQHSMKETYEESVQYNAPVSQMSSFSVTRDRSVTPLCSKIKHPPTTIFEELSSMSVIERYLLDDVDHWSIFHPFHRNDNSYLALSTYLQIAGQVLGIESDENEMFLLRSESLFRFKSQLRENDYAVDESIGMLTFDLDQSTPHLERNWSASRHSLKEYLLSNHRTYNTTSVGDVYGNLFGLLSRTSNLAQGGRNSASTKSLITSGSHKYGLTYSISEITGISDSIFMKP